MSAPQSSPDLDTFRHHWQDEADAAYLYRLLSAAEPDAKKKDMTIRPQSGAEIAALVEKAAETPKPVLLRTAQMLGWLK